MTPTARSKMERKRGKEIRSRDDESSDEKRFKIEDNVLGFEITDLDGDVEEGSGEGAQTEEHNAEIANAAETSAMINVSIFYLK